MNSVEQTIENVKLLIASGDLSDTPQLRRLHSECVRIFKDLKSNLEQCRIHVENGAIQEARQLNCSFEPSLTQVAEHLEFFKGSDFFAICRDYGLETPGFPDERLLKLLSTPASTGEKHLHGLLQDYRKIARNGTMMQRIVLLRKIVNKLPNSSRWNNDLISAERSRWQEIEREVEQLKGRDDCCSKLEELFREVSDPEWSIPPKEDVINNIRELLKPLQRARLNREVEARLQLLQDLWMERDLERLKAEFGKWNIFKTNPMIVLTGEQQQTVADIEKFCAMAAEEKRNQELCRELIRTIEQKLAEDVPFSALAGEYNQLQLMDCQIPPALTARLKSLEEEQRRCEHLHNVRQCVTWVSGAVLLIAVVIVAVIYTQRWITIKRNSDNMAVLMAEKRYTEVIDLYQKLAVSAPEAAASPKIMLFYTAAGNELKVQTAHRKNEEAKFDRLLRQISILAKEDVLDNAAALDKALSDARKSISENSLPGEKLDKFRSLETQITRSRTALKQKREQEFHKFSRDFAARVGRLSSGSGKRSFAELDISLSMTEKEFSEKMKAYPFVPAHLKEQAQKNFQAAVKKYQEFKKASLAFRKVAEPADFATYLKGLEEIRYQYPDLSQKYYLALLKVREWQQLYDSYSKFAPQTMDDVQDIRSIDNPFLREDLEPLFPKNTRSPAFARFYKGITLQKEMKELILTDAQGREYFFYLSGNVRIEKLRRPVRTNISFNANPVGKEKNRHFILSFKNKEKFPFKLLSKHGDLPYRLPQQFASLNGQTELSPKLTGTFWPGHALATAFSSLDSDGPGLNSQLQAALLYIAGENSVQNAYLKEILFIHFLMELCELSPLYHEITAKLQELQAFQQQRNREWRAPQIVAEYSSEREQLRQLWGQLDLKRLFAAGKLRGDFICAAHARGLIPVGVVREAGQGEIQISLFSGQKTPREGFVFDGKKLVPLPDMVWKKRMPGDAGLKRKLFTGQVIWSFSDGKTVREFVREWQKKAQALNVFLKVKPSIFAVEPTP